MTKWWPEQQSREDEQEREQAAMAKEIVEMHKLDDHMRRKASPVTRGVLDYFPDAIMEVARVSYAGSQQHHPDKPMHWDKSKSRDHADCIVRHLMDRGMFDTDGQRHTAKAAWRALALLQEELEKAAASQPN